jgi:acetate kinase
VGDQPAEVLVLNCGSSSVRFALLDPATGRRRLTGHAERVGDRDTELHLVRGDERQSLPVDQGTHAAVVATLLAALTDDERKAVVGVGHRVVHGGRTYAASVLVDDDVLTRLHALADLAPLHMPANLAGIDAARCTFGHIPHVAVFDTAFHQTMPAVAYRYAVPNEWYEQYGLRRYGFHGTSHRFVSARAAALLDRPIEELRMVTLHLGNGCSAAAISGGRSVDTTMGLTPLEGLVMGTRSGDLDPGAFGYLADRAGLELGTILEALNTRSGLLGLSGLSGDMRTLSEAADQGSEAAALALDVFSYRVAKTVGAFAVVLGGMDALVFTGGIGEHDRGIRAAVLDRLRVLGFELDASANDEHGRSTRGRISASGSKVTALVVPTDEELLIASDTADLVA